MALPPITSLPTPPSRGQGPDVFTTNADAFMTALPTFRTELNAFGQAVVDASVAASAVANYNATSTSSLLIATGSKTFAATAGKLFVVGQFVLAASAADSTRWMHGQVTAYNSTTGSLTVNVGQTAGAGTFADWVIGLSAPLPTLGWQTIATVLTTSGTTFDLTSIPSNYADLLLIFSGVSHNSGVVAALNLSVGDGTTLSSGTSYTNSIAAAGTFRGSILIPGYNEDSGFLNGGVDNLTTSPSLGTSLSGLRNWFVTGGIKAIRVSLTSGSGDLGSLILKGRK